MAKLRSWYRRPHHLTRRAVWPDANKNKDKDKDAEGLRWREVILKLLLQLLQCKAVATIGALREWLLSAAGARKSWRPLHLFRAA
jgi:hypothetical protein